MTVTDFVTIGGLLFIPQIVGYAWGWWERVTDDFLKEIST